MAPPGYDDIFLYLSDLTPLQRKGAAKVFGPGTSFTTERFRAVAFLLHWTIVVRDQAYELTTINYANLRASESEKAWFQRNPFHVWKEARETLGLKYECMKIGITNKRDQNILEHARYVWTTYHNKSWSITRNCQNFAYMLTHSVAEAPNANSTVVDDVPTWRVMPDPVSRVKDVAIELGVIPAVVAGVAVTAGVAIFGSEASQQTVRRHWKEIVTLEVAGIGLAMGHRGGSVKKHMRMRKKAAKIATKYKKIKPYLDPDLTTAPLRAPAEDYGHYNVGTVNNFTEDTILPVSSIVATMIALGIPHERGAPITLSLAQRREILECLWSNQNDRTGMPDEQYKSQKMSRAASIVKEAKDVEKVKHVAGIKDIEHTNNVEDVQHDEEVKESADVSNVDEVQKVEEAQHGKVTQDNTEVNCIKQVQQDGMAPQGVCNDIDPDGKDVDQLNQDADDLQHDLIDVEIHEHTGASTSQPSAVLEKSPCNTRAKPCDYHNRFVNGRTGISKSMPNAAVAASSVRDSEDFSHAAFSSVTLDLPDLDIGGDVERDDQAHSDEPDVVEEVVDDTVKTVPALYNVLPIGVRVNGYNYHQVSVDTIAKILGWTSDEVVSALIHQGIDDDGGAEFHLSIDVLERWHRTVDLPDHCPPA